MMGALNAAVAELRGEVGLAERVAGIEPFQVVRIFERARELEAEGRHVVHFEVGESDFPSAPPIIEAGASSLQAGHTGYTEGLGLPALREALAARYGKQLGIGADRVAVTTGASGALNVLAQVLVDPGAEVLGTDPGYPCNRVFVEAAGGALRALHVDASTGFQPTAAMIAEAWGPNTAGVLLGTPGNPSGSILPREELAAICAVARGRGFVIVDEIYEGLVYDDVPRESALAVDDELFVVNSFSKYFGMTGWRLGWLVAPEWAMDGIDRTAQNLYLAPPTVSQHAGLAALGPAAEVVHEQRREIFRRRRDQLLDGLDSLGLPAAHRPQGAFYIYVDVSQLRKGSSEFCRRLLEEHGVAVTPGSDFGRYRADDHVRFAFTVDETEIELGLERLGAALKRWR